MTNLAKPSRPRVSLTTIAATAVPCLMMVGFYFFVPDAAGERRSAYLVAAAGFAAIPAIVTLAVWAMLRTSARIG